MSLMSLGNGRRDNTFLLSFKLAAKVCIFAHIAKIFVSFLLYFHHFSYLCTRKKKQPLKTGVHWTLRGTDHSECLQQTDNQPSNWKGSTLPSSTKRVRSTIVWLSYSFLFSLKTRRVRHRGGHRGYCTERQTTRQNGR